MKLRRREFILAGGAAFFTVLGASASSTTEVSGPDATFQTPTSSGLLPLADPTFAANSQPTGGNTITNTPNYTAMTSACDAAVCWSTGNFITCSIYQEDTHRCRGYSSTGLPVGARTPFFVNPSVGIQSCALDGNYVWYLDGNNVARISISQTGFFAEKASDSDYSWSEQYTALSSSGSYFIGLAVTTNWLYVVDPNGAFVGSNNLPPSSTRIVPVSTNWTGSSSPYTASTGAPWNVPYCRQIAIDREGMLWALQVASVAASRAAVLSRWNPSTGVQLQSYTLPTSVYPMDIACDPNSDTVLIADNGRDQNFKKYSYDPNNINSMATTTGGPIPGSSTIGIQYGYLDSTQGTPGTLGPLRFVNPRAIAVDASGNVLVVQSSTPGAGDNSWTMGGFAIVSLLSSSGVEQWRNWGSDFGGNGEPSDDGTMFYGRNLSYVRSNAGINGAHIYRGQAGDTDWLGTYSQYLPYAYTADPWTYAGIEDRCADDSGTPAGAAASGGTGVRVVAGSNGSTYLFQGDGGLGDQVSGTCRVYQVPAGEAIAIPRTQINPSFVYRNGTKVSNPGLPGVVEGGWWVQPNMDLWCVWTTRIYRLRLTGFDASGTPLYGSAIDAFDVPAELSTQPMILRACGDSGGGTVYMAGYGPGQKNPNDEVRFKTIARYDNVPATGGGAFPAATWTYVPSFTDSGGIGYVPFGFCASPADDRIVIGWQQTTNPGQAGNGAELEFLVDSTTSSGPLHSSYYQLPGPTLWGVAGVFDIMSCVQAKNGYIWCEDDQCGKIIGKAVAGT